MAKTMSKADRGMANLSVRDKTRRELRRLAEIMTEDARKSGIPATVSMIDAAEVAVREAIEKRRGEG